MIKFKTFNQLQEQSRAPLYHGTSSENAAHIIKSGKIEASENGRTSLTRDKSHAKDGLLYSTHFKVDHDKLRSTHQVRPTDWHMGGSVHKDSERHDNDLRDPELRRSESEESVRGHVPISHVTHVSIHRNVSASGVKSIKDAIKSNPNAKHIKIERHGSKNDIVND